MKGKKTIQKKLSPRAATTGQKVAKLNKWRESYNPLRGLVMSRALCLVEAGERGEYADLQWLYRFIEKRDPVLRALILRRKAALRKLEWKIKICENLDEAKQKLAEKQRETLQAAYDLIDNLREAIARLALAEFRGFTILQKHRNESGDVIHFEWLPQWNWCRDGMFGDWYYNESAQSVTAISLGEQNRMGEEGAMAREDFIIREVDAPVDEIALWNTLRKGMAQKDWDAFVEIFGIPGCFVIMPMQVPAGKEEDFETAAEDAAKGGSGALPGGSDVKFSDSPRGNNPFKEHLDYSDQNIVLAGTGGKLTMLSSPTGIGDGAAEEHQKAFDEIAQDEAIEISEIFQAQFDKLILAAKHEGEPVLAYFEISRDEEDVETRKFKQDVWKTFQADGTVADILANLTDLKALTEDVGLPGNDEYVEPYLPVAVPAGEAPVTGELLRDSENDIIGAVAEKAQPSSSNEDGDFGKVDRRAYFNRKILNRDIELQRNASRELGIAIAADLQGVGKRIAEIEGISDPAQQRQALESLLKEIESKGVLRPHNTTLVLEETIAAAMLNGLAGRQVKNRNLGRPSSKQPPSSTASI